MHTMTRYGLIDEAPEGTPDSLAGDFRHQRALLERPIDEWRREMDVIMADTRLSDEGRRAALAAATRRAEAALEAAIATRLPGVGTLEEWRKGTEAYRADIEAGRALPEVPPLREDEIRRALREVSPAARFALAQEAAEEDDRETLRAIRNAPRVAPLLDARQLAAIDDIHRVAATPRVFIEGLAMRERVAERLDHNIFQARRTLRGEGRVALPMAIPAAEAGEAPGAAAPTVMGDDNAALTPPR